MKNQRTIAFLTDFGLSDPFVGICKGVIASINPKAIVIDLCHMVSPQNILEAAIYIKVSMPSFPAGTVFLTVVDPGVGTSRAALVLKNGTNLLVGPDNGVFSMSVPHQDQIETYKINRQEIEAILLGRGIRIGNSSTFHGRDIFAPAAALLSLGTAPEEFCSVYNEKPVTINIPRPKVSKNAVEGCILYFDHFGNGATSIAYEHMARLSCPKDRVTVTVYDPDGNRFVLPLKHTFSTVEPGSLVAYINSFGFLEIALNGKNAEKELGLKGGLKVQAKCINTP